VKVRLLTSRASATSANVAGDVIDVDDAEAVRLINARRAEPIRERARQTATPSPQAERAIK
jgi:hypothetical protein